MKRALRDKVLRIEFVSYYIFMTVFAVFLTYYSLLLDFTGALFPTLSLTIAYMSVIILYNYFYKSAEKVKRLILPYIALVAILFLTSTIAEALIYKPHIYVIFMKMSMCFLAVLTPITQYAHISHKITEYKDERRWNN